MNRRELLAGAGAFGFSLAVDARRLDVAPDEPVDEGARAAESTFGDEPNMRRVDREVDVLVAGGGMAGVCAALAAARRGARTLLVQDRSRLGGNASSEIRMHIVGADVHGGRAGWREGGLIEEIRLEDAVRNPHRAWELFDLTLYDLCVREPSLELLLDSAVYGAIVGAGRVERVFVRCDKTATIYRAPDGSHVLRLEDFNVTNGPDLHVILTPHANPEGRADVSAPGYVDLGKIKGNAGNQNYEIPAGVDVASQMTVVIYCQPFHVVFSTASLSSSG